MTTIGVLGLQGDIREHLISLHTLGLKTRKVKTVKDLNGVDGLIIPGGESTTLSMLMSQNGLDICLRAKIRSGFPIFGTCAGMILLARNVSNHSNGHLQLIDITVKRNAYGRQLDSFEAELNIDGIDPFPAIFIRAPYVEDVGAGVDVLARYEDKPVMVRQENILCCSFHPELTDNTGVHRYFGDMVESSFYSINEFK